MRVTESWRLKGERYKLDGVQAKNGKTPSYPPRPVHPRKVEVFDFSRKVAERMITSTMQPVELSS